MTIEQLEKAQEIQKKIKAIDEQLYIMDMLLTEMDGKLHTYEVAIRKDISHKVTKIKCNENAVRKLVEESKEVAKKRREKLIRVFEEI